MLATLRFFREFLRPRPGAVLAEQITYRRGPDLLPATLYHPARARPTPALPGWVALHGLTHSGREHPSLTRFARAVSASGAVVLVPDLPEWRELRVAPERTVETVKAAVLQLDENPLTRSGRTGVLGFSFGATQALIAATDPVLDGHLAGIAAWGGYADFRRTVRFGFLGTHELDGVRHELEPDPYGRWILAGNYLPLVPEHAGDEPVARELLELALEAGRRGVMSWSPETDPLKAAARSRLSPSHRELFDLMAPPAGSEWTTEERARLDALAGSISDAAVAHEPLLDAWSYLRRVPVPVFLAHGRGDRLMPWTEMVRLRRALPEDGVVSSTITSLFAHSFGERRFPTPVVLLEAVRFIRMIHRMLRLI